MIQYFQLPEHLWAYWRTWPENINERSSIMINQAAYNEIQEYLAPSWRSAACVQSIHPLPPSKEIDQMQQHHWNDTTEVECWHVNLLLDHHCVEQSVIRFEYRDGPGPLTTPTTAPRGKKHILPSYAGAKSYHIKEKAMDLCALSSCRLWRKMEK